MAVNNISSYNKSNDGMALPLSISRGNPNPLDDTSIYNTLAEAKEYASSNPIAYVGQIITVLNTDIIDSSVNVYVIVDEAGNLADISGKTLTVDGNTIIENDGILSATKQYQVDNTTITESNGILSAVKQLQADGITITENNGILSGTKQLQADGVTIVENDGVLSGAKTVYADNITIEDNDGTFSVIKPDMYIFDCGGAMAENDKILITIIYNEEIITTQYMGYKDEYLIEIFDGENNLISNSLFNFNSNNDFVSISIDGVVTLNTTNSVPDSLEAIITVTKRGGQ